MSEPKGRGAAWTEERSDEGRRDLKAARRRAESIVRVRLPAHLKNLARVEGEVTVRVPGSGSGPVPGSGPVVTRQALLDALEAAYPVLRGTIRDHVTGRRRAFVRFYACEQDLSNEPPDVPLPAAVIAGTEPFLIVGAMAGG